MSPWYILSFFKMGRNVDDVIFNHFELLVFENLASKPIWTDSQFVLTVGEQIVSSFVLEKGIGCMQANELVKFSSLM